VAQREGSLDWLRRRRRTVRQRLDLVQMLAGASGWLVGGAIAAASITGVLPVALALASGALSAKISIALAADGAAVAVHDVYVAFVIVMALFLLSEVMVPVQNRLRWLITKRVDGAARRRVMTAALAGSEMSHLHGDEYRDAMGVAHGLVRWSATPGAGAAGAIGIARDYVTGFAAAIVLATFSPLLAAVALAVALYLRVRWRQATLRIINVWIESSADRREGWYFTELGVGRTAAHEVRLFDLSRWLGSRIDRAGLRAWTPTWRERIVGMGRSTTWQVVLTGFVATFGIVWAGRAAAAGTLDVGGLVVFISTLFLVLGMGRYFDDDTVVEYGNNVLPAIRTLERLASNAVESESGRPAVRSVMPPTLELRNLSFTYPGSAEPVLQDVDLQVAGGTSIALVGVNGAGKTTLIRLICGLYRPSRGDVLIDGTSIGGLDLDAWHRSIALMSQEFLRLAATAADNVGVGAVENLEDRDGIRRALEEARAARSVEKLPKGMDSLLAARYADGADLSGGQWQRLGIARAMFALHHGARLLILDEPTANLDTMSEEGLVHRLLDGTRGSATTLLVTHRLALARRADQICVIADGHVAERGTHEQLLRAGGRYAQAFAMQASLYPLVEVDD
jgi:ATP-binding cassette, subfamily B, bacterial